MATWTSATFAFESLLTSTKLTQVQDNFAALAEGASGSPKVLAAALSQTGGSEAVVADTIRNYAVTPAKLEPYAIGSKVEAQVSASSIGLFGATGVYEKHVEYGMQRGGNVTVTWSAQDDSTGYLYTSLRVNGSERVGLAGNGPLSTTTSISVSAGDLVQLYIAPGGGDNPHRFHFTMSVSSGTTFRNL